MVRMMCGVPRRQERGDPGSWRPSRSTREMGRSSWGRDWPIFSILFPKGHLLFMVLFHSPHFLIFLRLSFFEQSWQPSLQRSDFSHNFCWLEPFFFCSLFIFIHTPRPLLNLPLLLCNLLIFYWCFFFSDASPSSHLNPSPSSASLNSWRQKKKHKDDHLV